MGPLNTLSYLQRSLSNHLVRQLNAPVFSLPLRVGAFRLKNETTAALPGKARKNLLRMTPTLREKASWKQTIPVVLVRGIPQLKLGKESNIFWVYVVLVPHGNILDRDAHVFLHTWRQYNGNRGRDVKEIWS